MPMNVNVYNSEEIPEDDIIIDSFFNCSWRLKGLLHENGSINYSANLKLLSTIIRGNMTERLSKRLADEALDFCINRKGTNSGNKAVMVSNCIGWMISKITEKKYNNIYTEY